MKGIKMWGFIILMALTMGFAAYGLWAYTNAESNDYAKVLQQIAEQTTVIQKLRLDLDGLVVDKKIMGAKIYELQKECDTNAQDMKQNHEHLTKVREQQYLINERDNSAKTMSVRMEKPLEVTIIEKEKPKAHEDLRQLWDSTGERRFHPVVRPLTKKGKAIEAAKKKATIKKVKSQLKELSR